MTIQIINLNGKDFLVYVQGSEDSTTYYLTYILNDYSYTLEYSIINKYIEKEHDTMIKIMESAMFVMVGKEN